MNVNIYENDLCDITVSPLTITFTPVEQHGNQEGIVFELPKSVSSDTIQEYLDQCIVPYLPGGDKSSNTDIGEKNLDSLDDIYLSFDGIEKDPDKFNLHDRSIKPIKFDSRFGKEYTNNLEPVMLKNLTFNLSFSQFNLKNIDLKDIDSKRATIELIKKQFDSVINSDDPPILDLHIQTVEYDSCNTDSSLNEDQLNEDQHCLTAERLRFLVGGEFKHPRTRIIRIAGGSQFCFAIRQDSRIDLYFYSGKDLTKKSRIIRRDFDISEIMMKKIFGLKPSESIKDNGALYVRLA